MEPTRCPETPVKIATLRCVISQKNADLKIDVRRDCAATSPPGLTSGKTIHKARLQTAWSLKTMELCNIEIESLYNTDRQTYTDDMHYTVTICNKNLPNMNMYEYMYSVYIRNMNGMTLWTMDSF
jgi:hypothetical protein